MCADDDSMQQLTTVCAGQTAHAAACMPNFVLVSVVECKALQAHLDQVFTGYCCCMTLICQCMINTRLTGLGCRD